MPRKQNDKEVLRKKQKPHKDELKTQAQAAKSVNDLRQIIAMLLEIID